MPPSPEDPLSQLDIDDARTAVNKIIGAYREFSAAGLRAKPYARLELLTSLCLSAIQEKPTIAHVAARVNVDASPFFRWLEICYAANQKGFDALKIEPADWSKIEDGWPGAYAVLTSVQYAVGTIQTERPHEPAARGRAGAEAASGKPDAVAVAVAMKSKNQTLSVRKIAKAVGIPHSTLFKDPLWKLATERLKQVGKGRLRRGSKPKDGGIEAVDE